jgi:hypothetical protein
MEKFKRSFPWQEAIKLKSCQVQSFITFWDLQLLFLLFVHPRSFKKFKFQIFGNTKVVFLDKMISNQKVINYKVSQLFGIYSFHFGNFSIRGHLVPIGQRSADRALAAPTRPNCLSTLYGPLCRTSHPHLKPYRLLEGRCRPAGAPEVSSTRQATRFAICCNQMLHLQLIIKIHYLKKFPRLALAAWASSSGPPRSPVKAWSYLGMSFLFLFTNTLYIYKKYINSSCRTCRTRHTPWLRR